jgi:hypothetical protein
MSFNTSSFRIFFVLFIFSAQLAFAQNDNVTKSFSCNDAGAYHDFDLQIYSRSTGDYEPQYEWSEKLVSNKILKKQVALLGDYQYVFLLNAANNVDGVGLEIRDNTGEQLEYDYKLNEPDNNELTVFYTPPGDGVYYLLFRVIGKNDQPVCTYMGVLKGEPDDDSQ